MSNFKIRFTLGDSSSKDLAKNFVGQNGSKSVEASNKIEAYKKFCDFFEEYEITVLDDNPRFDTPLGFSIEEINELKRSDIPFHTGYPQSGIQIQEIVLE